MKKGLLLVATGVLSLSLAACSSGLSGTEEEKEAAKQAQEEQQQATKSSDNSLNKVFVIPNLYLTRTGDSSEIDPSAVEHKEVTGENTKFTMSEKNIAEQSEKVNDGIVGALTSLAEGKTIESVTKVDTDDMYKHVKVYVDPKKFNEKTDPTVFGALAISIATYQYLQGETEAESKFEFIDEKTDKVLVTKSIPDDVSKE